MTAKKFSVYQMVTDRVIEQLKKGVVPWRQPWHGGQPAFNYISNKPYSLLNQLLLNGKGGAYMTFKQASEKGGTIRKGAKSSVICFYKQYVKKTEDDDGDETEQARFALRYYRVFSVDDIDGIEQPQALKLNDDIKPIERAEKAARGYIDREKIKFDEILSDRAFYSSGMDLVHVPEKRQFNCIEEYYSTLFHELAHSTGAPSRLDRFTNKNMKFASCDYSKEELIAEMSAAMVMASLGLETPSTFENSAAYLDGWMKALTKDSRLIVSAASKAEKAANFILKGLNNQSLKAV